MFCHFSHCVTVWFAGYSAELSTLATVASCLKVDNKTRNCVKVKPY